MEKCAPTGAYDPLSAYPDFARRVYGRLEIGRVEYGIRSFSRHPIELAEEVRDECLDIEGWGFWLDLRLARVIVELQRLEKLLGKLPPLEDEDG